MFKDRPFLLMSVIFGGIGVGFLIVAAISFLGDGNSIIDVIAGLFHLSRQSLGDESIAMLGCILMIPSFIFAAKAVSDAEKE